MSDSHGNTGQAVSRGNLVEEFGIAVLEAVHRNDRDGVIFFARGGDIHYINESGLRMFGASPDIVGRNFFDIAADDYRALGVRLAITDEHIQMVREALGGQAQRGEFVIDDGETRREIEVVYGPVRQQDALAGVVAAYRDVTEWRRLNEMRSRQTRELEEQRQFLASVLDVMDDGLIVLDEGLQVILTNAAASELLCGARASPGTHIRDVLAASCLLKPHVLAEQLERAVRSGELTSGIHIAEIDGALRCIEFSTVRTGLQRRQLICTLRDITEWQQLQQVQLLADIGRLSAEKTCVDDLARRLLDTIFDRLSVDIAVLTRYERDRLVPVAWRGMMLDPTLNADPLTNGYVQQALQEGRPIEGDGTEWDGMGGELTGTHFVVPVVSSGKTLGTLHMSALQSVRLFNKPRKDYSDPAAAFDRLDTTFLAALGGYVGAALQNVRLFEENNQERARLATAIEQLPEGVILFNARGEILMSNQAARDIAGVEWSNLNSDSRPYRIRDLSGKPLPRGEWPFFRVARADEALLADEIIFDFGDHQKHIQVSVVPVPGSDGQMVSYVGTIQDITERSLQDRRKGEFLSVASHELRSPLTPLSGFLQMMRQQAECGDRIDAALVARAEHQVGRLSRLIDGLLDMTRIETGRMVLHVERVDLRDIVHRSAAAWENHPREVRIQVHGPDHPVHAAVDPVRIDQVLTNLIDNAVKHSPRGATVRVDLCIEHARAVLRVEDHGEGIAPAALEHLFDRFYQAPGSSRQAGGMGLGLYITREIVEQHGGAIRIDSVEGARTIVHVELPLEAH